VVITEFSSLPHYSFATLRRVSRGAKGEVVLATPWTPLSSRLEICWRQPVSSIPTALLRAWVPPETIREGTES